MDAQILSTLEKNLKRSVEGIEGPIDPTRSLADYGANSLDIVEIVSATMRDLQIRIPRTELAGIRNIAGLVEAFEKYRA